MNAFLILNTSVTFSTMKSIPIHKLQERVDIGLEINYATADEIKRKVDVLGAHRDDHYIFFLIEKGTASLMIDFSKISLPEKHLYYILPGQVHHRINVNNACGWFLAVDTALIANEYREIFEDRLLLQQPYEVTAELYERLGKLLNLLSDACRGNRDDQFFKQHIYGILNSFLAVCAAGYSKTSNAIRFTSQPKQIAQNFKRLLSENYKTEKSPSAYAAMLNISGSYLNEALNKVTGLPVSYWITKEIMLEAKRLLYYTQLNVKEIAHQLGYDDHTYFSRLFKKSEGLTPLEFRQGYRE